MFLLHEAFYPPRPIALEDVRAAWLAAGFTKLGVGPRKTHLVGEEVKGIVNAHLLAAGATLTRSDRSDFEVPDSAEPLLKALETFYHALYPEMGREQSPRNFSYEKVEWLGEF